MKETDAYTIYWGDTHHNSYTLPKQEPSTEEVLSFAKTHLDFYSGAYYTPTAVSIPLRQVDADMASLHLEGHAYERKSIGADGWKGVKTEKTKDARTISREWNEFQEAIKALHSPNRFVTFPGYEWQGDGTWGDHNVIHKTEGQPVHLARTLPDLYDCLRQHEALAIPHHTGYLPGIRAPRWEYCDERLSPFAEIYSVHGCSETDEEWIGLRHNPHMGPGCAGGTYQDALDRGLHLGAICSTDNWSNVPGCWNQGLMACLATELTRDGLWGAFRNRRVYGVTGDRIELDFTCNGKPMGSILPAAPERHLQVTVRGQDAIDRIEILRNGQVIETYCHQGNWTLPSASATTRFKLRLECGWGPRLGEIPFGRREWTGEVSLSRGRFFGWSPCWITRGQGIPELEGGTARFKMSSSQASAQANVHGAIVLEFESTPATELSLRLNGIEAKESVQALARSSRIHWYRDECLEMLRKMTGIQMEELERHDPDFYHSAFKAKIHRVIPEAGYAASVSITDTEPLTQPSHYRVRVEQRNGQRAWSSPIWIEPK